jgi:hypothetical protein
MESARTLLLKRSSWAPAFDMRPSSLFEGVAQRLCFVLQGLSPVRREVFTGGYRRWSSPERSSLLAQTQFAVSAWANSEQPILKALLPLELQVREKISGPSIETIMDERTSSIYVHRICRYFVKALNFIPHFRSAEGEIGKSEDYKPFFFQDEHRDLILCLLNSSLFYWFWRCTADGFHCGYGDVYRMPYKKSVQQETRKAMSILAKRLMNALKQGSQRKSVTTKRGKIEYQEFYPTSTKPILNEIDCVLAGHYGFTDDELDVIINYDIKYRMGQEVGEDDGE